MKVDIDVIRDYCENYNYLQKAHITEGLIEDTADTYMVNVGIAATMTIINAIKEDK